MASYRFLFSPLEIGKVKIPNRASFSAHLTNFAENHLPSEKHVYYYAERAKGGTGLIITEEQSVHPTDQAYEKLIDTFNPKVIPGLRRIADAVHEYETKIFAQLNHNGQQCNGSLSRLPVWAPSPVPDVMNREVPKAMEKEDIEEVINGFALSAVNAREGRFDGVELQFGHSSLVRQFMSPLTNYRSDEYGGSQDNRLRFAFEVIEGARKAVGKDFTVGIRLCADEMIPGGYTIEDAKVIAARLEATGQIDFIDLTLATFYNLYLVGASMHNPLGYTIPLAAAIKKSVKLPVFATGRINDPALAEKVLADGQADVIGMVRSQICDPELLNKAKQGREEEIRYCIACNQFCYGRIGLNKPIGCVQNPVIEHEKDEGSGTLKPALVKKKVMVVGGGPAGMWAAKTAMMRGHNVEIYEKESDLGGQVNIAAKGAGREEFGVIVRNEKAQLKKYNIKVNLNTEVTLELVEKVNPDVLIIATGSVPKKSPVYGADAPDIFNVWQVLKGQAKLGNKILLIDYDGHHQATATAEFLADQGKNVHMICSSLFIGAELGPTQDLYLTRQRLLKKGVTFTPDIAVMEIKDKTAYGFNVYSNVNQSFGGYDSIVLAMGNDADDRLYFDCKAKRKNVYRIGDCVAPRKVDMAIYEGYQIGRKI
jgi:mycofactocin system FadH/OYE family oxidoreductase 2